MSSPATSTFSWSPLNKVYQANIEASSTAIQLAYVDIALLSPPNSPDYIFPSHANIDYIYNPLVNFSKETDQPNSLFPHALLELAAEAIYCQQLKEKPRSPKFTLQYPPLEDFVIDEDIPS